MPSGAGELLLQSTELLRSAGGVLSPPSPNSMPVDPITSSIATSIQLTFKLAEFILKVTAASEEIDVFARLIRRVQRDREEALRERRLTNGLLLKSPEKLKWVNTALSDVDYALHVIGRIIQNARIDTARGKGVTLKSRFEWVMAHKDEFLAKQTLLSTCHASLIAALSFMHGLPHETAPKTPIQEDSDDDAPSVLLRGPTSMRPKPKQTYVLPDTSPPSDTEPLFADLWEKFSMNSLSEDGSRQELLSDDQCWTELDQKEILMSAKEAIKSLGGGDTTTRILTQSVQPSALGVRRRRREATFLDGEDSNGDDPSELQAVEFLAVDVDDANSPAVSRQSSAVSRRRNIAAHFDS